MGRRQTQVREAVEAAGAALAEFEDERTWVESLPAREVLGAANPLYWTLGLACVASIGQPIRFLGAALYVGLSLGGAATVFWLLATMSRRRPEIELQNGSVWIRQTGIFRRTHWWVAAGRICRFEVEDPSIDEETSDFRVILVLERGARIRAAFFDDRKEAVAKSLELNVWLGNTRRAASRPTA